MSIYNNMNKIISFLKCNKYAAIWTIFYCAIIWFILITLFNFDIFSIANWLKLYRSELRGIPGFVFGILILSILPIYIATTLLVIRTKEPLFKISLLKLLRSKFNKKIPEKEEEKVKLPETKEDIIEEKPLPEGLPTELKIPFLRSRSKGNVFIRSKSILNSSTYNDHEVTNFIEAESINESDQPKDISIPEDFNLDMEDEDISNAPIFKDINFDDDILESSEEISTISYDKIQDLVKLLKIKNENIVIDEDIITTDELVIAIHNDKSFWIVDEDNWFAEGKQKRSPISKLLEKTANNDKQAILYLITDNIMSLDDYIKEWEKEGIKIIRSEEEILNQ